MQHPKKPNPTELFAHMRFPSSVEKQRNLYCHLYDQCLSVAVREGWEGWTCMNCPLFNVQGQAPRAEDFASAGRRE
ncbi:MAG: hypothetical protein M3Y59_01210 [Myxococcota bacterium]|nr:hypothetical protein [Myxococcota bacterium]